MINIRCIEWGPIQVGTRDWLPRRVDEVHVAYTTPLQRHDVTISAGEEAATLVVTDLDGNVKVYVTKFDYGAYDALEALGLDADHLFFALQEIGWLVRAKLALIRAALVEASAAAEEGDDEDRERALRRARSFGWRG